MGEIGLGGSTLVDIVNKIWSLSANAIDKIKEAATYVINAVKAGVEWLSNEVLNSIYTLIGSMTQNILNAMFGIFAAIDPDLELISYDPLIVEINGNQVNIDITANQQIITIGFGDTNVEISNLLTSPKLEQETLSLVSDKFMGIMGTQLLVSLAVFGIYALLVKSGTVEGQSAAILALTSYFVGTYMMEISGLENSGLGSSDFDDLKSYLNQYHGFAIISALATIMLTGRNIALYGSVRALIGGTALTTFVALLKEAIFVNLIPTIVEYGLGGISNSYEPLIPELMGAIRGASDVFILQKVLGVETSFLSKGYWLIFVLVEIVYHMWMQYKITGVEYIG